MAFGVLDFIDADGIDLSERAMFKSPGNDMLNCVETLVLVRLPSAQGASSTTDAAVAAVDAPYGVQQKDEESPGGNKRRNRSPVYGGASGFGAMEPTTILNRCHHFRGFVYQHARFSADKNSIEVVVRQRKGSAANRVAAKSPP